MVCTFVGEVYWNDIDTLIEKIYSHRTSGQFRFHIINLLNAKMCLSEEDMSNIAAVDRGISLLQNQRKMAFIATSVETIEACLFYIKKSEDLDSPWECKIFPTVEKAERWATQT